MTSRPASYSTAAGHTPEPTLMAISARHGQAGPAKHVTPLSKFIYVAIRTEIAAGVGSNERLRCSHGFTPEEVVCP